MYGSGYREKNSEAIMLYRENSALRQRSEWLEQRVVDLEQEAELLRAVIKGLKRDPKTRT